jgi:hypothetical protein
MLKQERGGGPFADVVRRAQTAGAAGVIFGDVKDSKLFVMATDDVSLADQIFTPSLLISHSDSLVLFRHDARVRAKLTIGGNMRFDPQALPRHPPLPHVLPLYNALPPTNNSA